jgi:predicted nucleotidyltransferase
MQLLGNKTHQKILQLLINLFQNDKNIRAFIIFGSLVRGNWDKYSDLDLDVVVKEIKIDIVLQEIDEMVKVLNKQIKILHYFEEFTNEQVIILDSLDRISIRFHRFEETKPAILDSMKVLYGNLSEFDIKKSILQEERKIDLVLLNNKFLELAIYVQLSLKRNKIINASFFLSKMRQIIIEIYAKSRGKREFDFEAIADEKIKQEMIKTYFLLNYQSMKIAFEELIDLYKNSISEISSGKIILQKNEKLILEKVIQY